MGKGIGCFFTYLLAFIFLSWRTICLIYEPKYWLDDLNFLTFYFLDIKNFVYRFQVPIPYQTDTSKDFSPSVDCVFSLTRCFLLLSRRLFFFFNFKLKFYFQFIRIFFLESYCLSLNLQGFSPRSFRGVRVCSKIFDQFFSFDFT